MNPNAIKLSVLASVCALSACSSVSVTTDYDHAASFNHYKTYAVEPAIHGRILSHTSDAALREELRTQLGKRGITETASEKADIVIVPHAFGEHKVSVQEYTDWGYGYHGTWPYQYGHYNMWAGAPQTYVDVNHYTEGTLILDVVDLHRKTLVFRGVGTAVVGGPEDNGGKIREAVEKMVETLPAPVAH